MPLAIITVLHVSANATTHHFLEAVSTQCQPVSTSIKLVSTYIKLATLQSDKSHLFKWLFKKNGFLAVSGSDLGIELLTSSLRMNSSWSLGVLDLSQYIRPSMPCIKSQAIIRTISWNRWKCSLSCLWTGQDFSSLLTPDLILLKVRAPCLKNETIIHLWIIVWFEFVFRGPVGRRDGSGSDWHGPGHRRARRFVQSGKNNVLPGFRPWKAYSSGRTVMF